MAGYNLFQPSTLGMMAQSHALNTIGINVANVNTGGYKATDTRFETMISKSLFEQSDLGGVKPKNIQRIDKQGILESTSRDLDLAIVGDGFFYVSPDLAVSGEMFYTRDGSFQIGTVNDITVPGVGFNATTPVSTDPNGNALNPVASKDGYLVDKNGMFVLGAAAQADGTFTAGGLAPMRIDQFAFINQSTPTTTAALNLNLPAEQAFGATPQRYNIDVIDSNGTARTIRLDFAKSTTDNQWGIVATADNVTTLGLTGAAFSTTTPGTAGTGNRLNFTSTNTLQIESNPAAGNGVPVPGAFFGLKVGDQITVANTNGAAANNGTFTIASVAADSSSVTVTGTPFTAGFDGTDTNAATVSSTQVVTTPLTFSQNGTLTSPSSYTVSATWSDAATSSFTLDVSDMVQFAGGFTPFSYSHNGQAAADLTRVQFDSAGHVIGTFSDGTQRKIYKIPLAVFANENGLEMKNGMIFAETQDSGPARTVFADTSDVASFNPFAVELSNVDLAGEFTKMIVVQNAYNSAATVFRTVDEMTTVARDLKA